MELSVIICTYNRAKLLRSSIETAVESLLKLQKKSYELLVIDNRSSDETALVVREFQEKFWFIKYIFEPNQGLSYARNRGIKQSRGDVIAFVDDDVKVHPNWALNLVKYFKDPEVMCVGGRILPWWEKTPPKWLTREYWSPIALLDHGDEPKIMNNTHLWGANLAFRKNVFQRYGFFDVNLGRKGKYLLSGEETELLKKLVFHGEKVIYAPDVIVYHFVSKERLKRYYFLKWRFYSGVTKSYFEKPLYKRFFWGIPLFYYRKCFREALNCFFKLSFKKMLDLSETLGMIYGYKFIAEHNRHDSD